MVREENLRKKTERNPEESPHAFMQGGEMYLKTDKEIRDAINGLEFTARELLITMKELRIEDMYFMSVVDKSLKLIDPFLFAYRTKNIDVMAVLTRIQMDCVMRTFALSLVENSSDFCKNVLYEHMEVHRLKDKRNRKLDDKYMCERLGEYLKLPVYQLYQLTCEFIHFSSRSFNRIAKIEDDNHFSLFVSKKNRPEDAKEYRRLSKELANQFYYFGYVLQNNLLQAWLDQLEREAQQLENY